MQILAIPGSLRSGSYNGALLRAAQQLAPEQVQVVLADLREIPFYDGDLEAASGLPEPVLAFKRAIAQADGLLIATPEYNGGYPGLLKNAIDWATRPHGESAVFANKPVGLLGASPGRQGTVSAQTAWLPIFRNLSMQYFSASTLYVGGAHALFNEEGELTDEPTQQRLAKYLQAFSVFASQ